MAEIQELVEAYRQGALSRREFIGRVVMVAGGLAAAPPYLAPLGISEVEAAQVDPNDPTLESKIVQFPGKAGTAKVPGTDSGRGVNIRQLAPNQVIVGENAPVLCSASQGMNVRKLEKAAN